MSRNGSDASEVWATGYRDAGCGQPDAGWTGRAVKLAGWVNRRRDLGGLVFVDLRDRTGIVQLSIGPDWSSPEALELAAELGPEDVVQAEGEIIRRPTEAVNPEMPSGEVELQVRTLRRLSASAPLPILVAVPPEESLPSEELRLRHRILDLRRPEMMEHFEVRHRATAAARRVLGEAGFLEVETPILTRRTPEGARDYLVPSRMHRGEFYALPQSPQLYKQLLMASGFDRYFQIARCLRDEDLRADRQPEFTQVDAEMALVVEEDVFRVAERMLSAMWEEGTGTRVELPFPRIPYAEALERYGTDKPDLRVPWALSDFTAGLAGRGFGVVDGAVAGGGRVRGFVVPGGAAASRKQLDGWGEVAREQGAGGVLWLKRGTDGWSGPPARFLDEDAIGRLAGEHGVEEGDLVLLVAGPDAETHRALDLLRRTVAGDVGAVEPGWKMVWVVEFPFFLPDPESGRPVPAHHPFTMPAGADVDRLRDDPFGVRAEAYDVVCNGTEILSGSIRCHDPELQRTILTALGLSDAEVERRFGFLLEAFRYGTPPHGGFAAGLDRIVTLMVGEASIREVIAFPKTTAARGLAEGAPAPVEPEELRELGIRVEEESR
ncbi:MAG: aspartate--tRNA ligase [Gemmatimonadota bacterium]